MVVFEFESNLRALCRSRHSKNKGWSKHNSTKLFAALFLIPFLLAVTATGAVASDWVVKRVSGIVYFVAPGVEAFRAKKGMVFEKGYTIGTTGRRPGSDCSWQRIDQRGAEYHFRNFKVSKRSVENDAVAT